MEQYTPQVLTRDQLVEKVKTLPLSPGVYLFYDADGTILYVGKSRALRNRVLSYFQNRGNHSFKTERLVQNICDVQTIVTSSETEALILENEKIKLHQPKYNIRLKDDKDYPYVRLSLEEDYPRLSFSRRRQKEGEKAKYFGPYSSSSVVRVMIDTANKLFSLPTCKRKFPRDIGKERPCLYYHMGKCIGVCTGEVSPDTYRARIEEVISFFRHDHKKIASRLKSEMEEAAEQMDFEKAAVLRDRLKALQSLSESPQVVRDLHFEADVFGVYSDETGGCITRLCVRSGKVIDSVHYHFGAREIINGDAFSSFLFSLYRGTESLPKQILLSSELEWEEWEVISSYLSEKQNRKVRFHIPERGEGRALVQMAQENAKAAELHRRAEQSRDENVLVRLASVLSLEVLPERIESIDISNSGSDSVFAGIITLQNGRFLKRAYKTFSIQIPHPDDPACMYEAISRRMKRFLQGDPSFSPLPDLILVDGSFGQVSAVKKALEDVNLTLPVFGMVKDSFHKARCLTDGEHEISIAYDTQLYRFIYGIQEEVHRFSFSGMDSRRRKSVKSSALTEIPGIGGKKASILLRHFGSVKAIRLASEEQLRSVQGISSRDAKTIFETYHKNETEKETKQ